VAVHDIETVAHVAKIVLVTEKFPLRIRPLVVGFDCLMATLECKRRSKARRLHLAA
jgi:hypothetical protein